jgi:2-amino-4-hydroxy-6-hydroxymethyldihydropteridine diphosphokinase
MAKAYIGIGSNIGDRRANCEKAVSLLKKTDGIELVALSSMYDTKPVGGPPQEDYLNGVIEVETRMSPGDLFNILKNIEKEMGREDRPSKDHPRIIDLDVLMYGKLVLDEEDLVIPHPRMHERAFVLRGFEEIAPEEIHPVLGKTVSELYGSLKASKDTSDGLDARLKLKDES